MEHYVTLFDSLYLPQGLALHASLERHAGAYKLWILCMDDIVHEQLSRLPLPNCTLLKLSELETPELLAVKPGRSKGEYCWTVTPFSARFVFEADADVQRVTYVDADVWLRKSPAPLFAELEDAGAQVLITDHGYSPEYDESAKLGQYCVQFMSFTRGGEPVRRWWEERCVEWCFARPEDGKFGDQKYLDDWPERFKGLVHALRQQHLTLAPWNATRYPYGAGALYHFHGLRILSDRSIYFGHDYALPAPLVKQVYGPYVNDLREALAKMDSHGIALRPQGPKLSWAQMLYRVGRGIARRLWRTNQFSFRRG